MARRPTTRRIETQKVEVRLTKVVIGQNGRSRRKVTRIQSNTAREVDVPLPEPVSEERVEEHLDEEDEEWGPSRVSARLPLRRSIRD